MLRLLYILFKERCLIMSKQKSNQDFKPYVPASQKPPEFTWMALLLGGLLAIIFGAANAYLGLIVGMTVSASIPAAVISMAVLGISMKRTSILENNIVQTITSSGKSLAARLRFSRPALFLWTVQRSLLSISIIALAGGRLGVVLLIPLPLRLIVEAHTTPRCPEGTDCPEVLEPGGEGENAATLVLTGLG